MTQESKICPRCGGTGPFNKDRKSKDGLAYACRECTREYIRNWKRNNPDKPKEYAKGFYARNIERARAERRKYYAEKKEQMNARVRANYRANSKKRLKQISEWKEANWNRVLVMSNRRRGRKIGAAGKATEEQINARIALFGGMCAYCAIAPYEHLDHAIPLSRGGTNWPANLRPACAKCNLSKNARIWNFVKLGQPVDGDCVKRAAA